MAVELSELYKKIPPACEIQLLTESCFNKKIEWIHMVEDIDFVKLLHGNELVFNSGVRPVQTSWLMPFIKKLNNVHAGGLILTSKNISDISSEVIAYCNKIRFPLFYSSWYTPYVDIMRTFSEILIRNEHNEVNLTAALKQAICHPEDVDEYLNHFEMNEYFQDMSYVILILSCFAYNTEHGNERLEEIQKLVQKNLKKAVFYKEKGRLVILTCEYTAKELEKKFNKLCTSDSNVYVGIGSSVSQIQNIHRSYENAYTAYELTKTTIPKNVLCYDSLGVYKLLADVKVPEIYMNFAIEVLGNLMQHDEENNTDYMNILNTFFDNDCSILNTSQALFCHKNTLNYKMNTIKDILGYDIMCNENRTKIMMAFYILRLGSDYYIKKGWSGNRKIFSPFEPKLLE